MAKKKKQSDPSLSGAAARLADPASAESQVAAIRVLERKLAAADHNVKAERLKREHAERELTQQQQTTDQLLATRDRFEPGRLERIMKRPGGSATAVICCQDWHLEERVDPAVVNGLNEFNLDIAARRIERLWRKAVYLIDFARRFAVIRDAVLWLGGDLINGYIHEELEEGNFLGPTEAILAAQQFVAEGLEYIRRHAKLECVRVACNFGNHGRSTKKRRISTGYKTSWEYLAYCNLAARFSTPQTCGFQVERGYHALVDVQGHLVRFHHGDAIKFGGGVGGVHIPLRKKIAQWNKTGRTPACDFLGHFHQYGEDWNYVLSGCLVGYNAYALDIGAEYQPPSQTLAVIDRQYGKVLAMPIFVEEAVK